MEIQPPYGPLFGGVWEKLIQSARRTLLLILRSRRLSFDTFLTIMVETKTILNSRPLTNVGEQPDNEETFTLNHFFVQRPFNRLPQRHFGDQQFASVKTWKNTQNKIRVIIYLFGRIFFIHEHVWRHLVEEYLPTISRRSKWPESSYRPLKVNDIVWVLKDQTPKCLWPLQESWKQHLDEMDKRES